MNRDVIERITEARNGKEIMDIILEKINSLYSDEEIIGTLLTFVQTHKKQVFMYLKNPNVKKTSDKAEQHFSIQSCLLKHRLKTNKVGC